MTEAAIFAALVVTYAALARRLDRWSITPALAFVAAGALLGPTGTDALPVSIDAESTKLLAELALAVLLFGDATTINPRGAEHDARLTSRLLFVGLPVMILVGTAMGAVVLTDVSWTEAALVAAIVAPTDAALGMAVFTNRAVPARVRRVLNVESGLNDGIATPVVAFLIAAVIAETPGTEGGAVAEALEEMVIGAAWGVAAGAIGGLLLLTAVRRGWASTTSVTIGVLALAGLAYTGAIAAGGNGFVAAFLAGLAFRAATGGGLRERVEYTETTGQVLTVIVWTIFGALVAAPAISEGFEPGPIAYAVLSLTVVRVLSVAVALTGAHLQWRTVLFMGWFGPRGLASVVFTMLLLIEVEAVHTDVPRDLALAASWTILLSVVAHGLSASSLGRRYGAAIDRLGPGLPETEGPEPPRRRGRGGSDPTDAPPATAS